MCHQTDGRSFFFRSDLHQPIWGLSVVLMLAAIWNFSGGKVTARKWPFIGSMWPQDEARTCESTQKLLNKRKELFKNLKIHTVTRNTAKH